MTVRNRVEPLAGSTEEDMTVYDENADPRETAGGNDVPRAQVGPLGEAPWLLQVSLKTTAGALINIRGMNSWDIAAGLQAISDLAAQITETEALFVAHTNLAPIRSLPQPQVQQGPPPSFVPQQPQQQWGQQGAGQPMGTPDSAPLCKHGMPAKFVPGGISKSTGRPYRAFWACSLGRDQQCDFRAQA